MVTRRGKGDGHAAVAQAGDGAIAALLEAPAIDGVLLLGLALLVGPLVLVAVGPGGLLVRHLAKILAEPPDAGLSGVYHVMAILFMEGGGIYEPVPGVDYMAATSPMMFGAGQVEVTLDLELVELFPARNQVRPVRH